MRTTLNLNDDVAARLKDLARREGRSLSGIVNDLLRAGLGVRQRSPALPRYEPPTFDTGRPMIDVTDIAGALEVLGDGP